MGVITDKEKLKVWLVFMRFQFSHGRNIVVPPEIAQAFIDEGWLAQTGEPDEDGDYSVNITNKGTMIADLLAPEWGINPIPQEVQ